MKKLIVITVFLSVLGCQKAQEPTHEINGEWESVKFEGSDVGDFISKMKFSFETDSSFHGIAYMFDGSSNERSGKFHIQSDLLTMVENGDPIKGKYHFRGDTLVIHDPKIDSQVFLLQTSNP